MGSSCENQPLRLVLELADELLGQIEVAARAAGITPQQARTLMQLEEPRRMSDLASTRCVDPSSVTSLIDRLERDGLVVRQTDPSDGRARQVALTPAGRRTRTKFFTELSVQPDPFGSLTDDQRRSLVERLAVRNSADTWEQPGGRGAVAG